MIRPKCAREVFVLTKKFMEVGGCIGLGKLLMQDLLSQKHQNFNVVVQGHNLRCGGNFMQLQHHLTRVSDLYSVLEN